MLVKIANREDTDHTASSVALFVQATMFAILEHLPRIRDAIWIILLYWYKGMFLLTKQDVLRLETWQWSFTLLRWIPNIFHGVWWKIWYRFKIVFYFWLPKFKIKIPYSSNDIAPIKMATRAKIENRICK